MGYSYRGENRHWERGKEIQTFLGVFTHVHINMVLLKMWMAGAATPSPGRV